MSREIKFRALDEESKEIIYLDDVSVSSEYQYYEDDHSLMQRCKNNTLMQFIGLKDKYGTEIYEGDIVDVEFIKDSYYLSTQYIIEYKDYGFYFRHKEEDENAQICGYDCCVKSIEIIGNKYENQNLLDDLFMSIKALEDRHCVD